MGVLLFGIDISHKGLFFFSEVKFYDVFTFDVLDAVNDKVVQLFHVGGGGF